jgi:hypothetical protein
MLRLFGGSKVDFRRYPGCLFPNEKSTNSVIHDLAMCLASVAGLAPARVGLKIRLRELLCIHGQKMVAAEDENPELLLAGRH